MSTVVLVRRGQNWDISNNNILRVFKSTVVRVRRGQNWDIINRLGLKVDSTHEGPVRDLESDL